MVGIINDQRNSSGTKLHPPQNLYFEALTPNVTVFRDKSFKEVIKIKWGHKGGALILQN